MSNRWVRFADKGTIEDREHCGMWKHSNREIPEFQKPVRFRALVGTDPDQPDQFSLAPHQISRTFQFPL